MKSAYRKNIYHIGLNMKRTDNFIGDEDRRKRQRLNQPIESFDSIPEWDDDFNNDLLEEVCVVAELSQCVSTVKRSQPPADEGQVIRLKEQLKTKEGEIVILRSQINHQEISKRTETINNKKAIDQLKNHYEKEIALAKRKEEELKNELEFKDLEVKGLIDKCKELEVKSPKLKYIEPGSSSIDDRKPRFILSQAISARTKPKEIPDEDSVKFSRKSVRKQSEGSVLWRHISSDFFKLSNDPCFEASKMFELCLGCDRSDKLKFKWAEFPQHASQLGSLYAPVTMLCQSDIFPPSILDSVFKMSQNSFMSLKDVLGFLCQFPHDVNNEKRLLESTDTYIECDLKCLLGEKPIRDVEYGIETRRVLSLLTCILMSRRSGCEELITHSLLRLIKDIVSLIGRLSRPVEFSGVLISTLRFLRVLLEKNNVNPEQLTCIRTIIEETIFARPTLDVLQEVILTTASGSAKNEIIEMLCRRCKSDTTTIYMDSKLRQAVFFSPDACPLKILQMQVKTRSHLAQHTPYLLSVTRAIITLLQSIQMNCPSQPEWILPAEHQCCDILECFSYLLYLCVCRAEDDKFRSILELGIVTLRNCSKGHQRKLKNSTVKLLPGALKRSSLVETMPARCQEAAMWIIANYESEIHEHEISSRSSI